MQFEMFKTPATLEEKLLAGYRYDPETGEIYSRRREWQGRLQFVYAINGYAHTVIDGVTILRGRLAFLLMKGRWPVCIDHINRDRSDDRWCNLREVTHRENCRNKSDSGLKYSNKGKFDARVFLPFGIENQSRNIYFGRYQSSADAEKANAEVRQVADAIDRYHLRPFTFKSFRELSEVADYPLTEFIDQSEAKRLQEPRMGLAQPDGEAVAKPTNSKMSRNPNGTTAGRST